MMNAIEDSRVGNPAGNTTAEPTNDAKASWLRSVLVRSCLETAPAQAPRPRSCQAPAPERPRHDTLLHQLKRQMLAEELERTDCIELSKHLCGAANEAASLAWSADEPVVAFPCLFKELVESVKARFAPATLKPAGTRAAPRRVSVAFSSELIPIEFQIHTQLAS